MPVCPADALCKVLASVFAKEARLRPRAGSEDDDADEAAPLEDVLSGDEEETEEGHGLHALLHQLQQLSGHLLAARATAGTHLASAQDGRLQVAACSRGLRIPCFWTASELRL